ncbi:MAG: methylated-DNA--[protein]-cysteine S-methyltransferase [Nitrospinae bacterium]|nr:methylated-DNA--[protein]-cysteine S-methyltransferase [Nitrospinota bacterium]
MTKIYTNTPLDTSISYTVFSNPIGLTGLVATSNGLLRIINKLKNENSIEKHLALLTNGEITKKPSDFKDLVKQFALYFKGNLREFDFPLDLSLGTPFQQKVWKKLITIPYGKTRSYKWLASAIKNPQASRAVGNANGKNPLSIVIPCHRVVRENGDLGGYTGGVSIKRFLLDLEQDH